MECAIQKENEELKEVNKKLEEEIENLRNKVEELMGNFGKDKRKKNEQRNRQ